MNGSFWRISLPDYQRVCAVMNDRGGLTDDAGRASQVFALDRAAPLIDAPLDDTAVVFCMKRSNRPEQREMIAWIDEIGAQCRVASAGSFMFLEFAQETDAVAFKLRWYGCPA